MARHTPKHSVRAERRGRWRVVALVTLVVVAAVVVLAGGTLSGLMWYGSSQVGRVDVEHLQVPGDTDGDGTVDVEELTEVLNVLVVGSDSRDGLSDEQLAEIGTDRAEGNRTDTIMLVQLDPRRDEASVLSFPRDLLVTRCDGTRGRINAAYGIGERSGDGGPSCLVETVTQLTGVAVNHFVQVDFAGFIDIVDAIGGVRLYLDEPLVDPYAGLDLPAGCVDLDGTAALGFVRSRHLDSDFGRIARQQRFLREVASQAASLGTLLNPARVLSLVEAVGDAVDADRELSAGKMRRIAFSLRDLGPDAIDMRTVPGDSERINGAWYVVPDEQRAEELFAAFREAREAPETLGTAEPDDVPTLEPGDVPGLVVLNGAGVAGLGGLAADALDERGFAVATIGNAEHYDHARTEVAYPEALAEEAELVAAALGGAQLREGEAEDITVTLGADFEVPEADASVAPAAREPTAEPTAAATSTPSPEPTFQGATASEGC